MSKLKCDILSNFHTMCSPSISEISILCLGSMALKFKYRECLYDIFYYCIIVLLSKYFNFLCLSQQQRKKIVTCAISLEQMFQFVVR